MQMPCPALSWMHALQLRPCRGRASQGTHAGGASDSAPVCGALSGTGGGGAGLGPVSTGLALPKGLARGARGAAGASGTAGAAGLLSASAAAEPLSLEAGAVCWEELSWREIVLRRVSTGLAAPKGLERGALGAAGCWVSVLGAVSALAEEAAGEDARLGGGRSGGGIDLGCRTSLHACQLSERQGSGLGKGRICWLGLPRG